jgi:hypothetical protein
MDLYYHLTGIPPEQQVAFAASLLSGHAALWYRLQTLRADDIPFATWAQLKEALRKQFNHVRRARDRLAALHQTGSVRKYITAFSALSLEIPDLTPVEQLDRFIRGLKPAVRREVEIRAPGTFEEAATIADRVDSIAFASTRGFETPTSSAFRSQSRPPSYTPMELDAMDVRKPAQRQQQQQPAYSREERQRLRDANACFYCRKTGHLMRDCPIRPPRPKALRGPRRGST